MKRPTVLVVASTPGLADSLLPVLGASATEIVVVTSFSAGKQQLLLQPRLLITELRLGEYNGLHLALRAHANGIPTIVIGDADPVLQRDAATLGATYVVDTDPIAERIEPLVERTLRQPAAMPASDIAWGVYSGQRSGTASVWETVLASRPTTSYH